MDGDANASWFGRRSLRSIQNCSGWPWLLGCAVRSALCLPITVQDARQVAAGMRLRIARGLLRRPRGDNFAAAVAAFRPQINQPVRRLNDVQVVLDDQERSAAVKQLAERAQEFCDVIEVQSR